MASHWSGSSTTEEGQHPYPNVLPLLDMLETPASSSPGLTPSRMEMLAVHLYPGKLVAFQPSSEAIL